MGSAKFEARAEPANPQTEMIPQDAVVVHSEGGSPNEPVTYSLRIYKDSDRIKLKGNMSSEEDYKTLIGLVKASFPSAGLSDRVEVNDAASDSDVKIGGLSFALKLLGYLEKGRATVDDNGLSLQGAASTAVVLNEVQRMLEEDRPTGVPLKNIRIAPPHKSWTASFKQGGALKITGILPSEASKQTLAKAAADIFPDCELSDVTGVEKGVPEKWTQVALHSLKLLRLLNRGSIEITDQAIQLKGAAKDEAMLRRIEKMAEEMPGGLSVHSEVTAPADSDVAAVKPEERVQ